VESELQNSLDRLAEDALPVTLVFRAGEISHDEYMRLPPTQRRKSYARSSVAGKGCLVYLGESAIGAADVGDDGRSVRLRDDTAKAGERAGDAQLRVLVSAGRAWRAPEELSFGPGDTVVLDQRADEPLDVFMPGTDSVWMKGEALTVDDCFGVRLQACAPQTRSHDGAANRLEVEVILGEGVFPISDVAGAGDGTICPLETNCLEPMTLTCSGVALAKGYLEVVEEPSTSEGRRPSGHLAFVVTQPLGGQSDRRDDDSQPAAEPSDRSEPAETRSAQPSIDAILDHYPVHRLFVVLEHGPPQTAAWLVKRLAVLDRSKASRLFTALRDRLDPSFVPLFALCRPFATERSVCRAIAESMLGVLSPDERTTLLDDIEAFSGASGPEASIAPDAHLRTTADVVAELPEPELRALLENVGAVDAEAARQIESFLLFIADIARLSDRNVQKLLRELDMQDLVLCLADADETVLSAVVRNMSTRAARMLEEERRFLKKPNQTAVDEAKARVLRILSTLLENGDIDL
jgi:flagellar motor switch/type III secretory pathway protein FliN